MVRKMTIPLCIFFLLLAPIAGFQVLAVSQLKIGFASVDLTPEVPIMLVGYAARTEPSKGIVQPIYARALAFEDTTGQRAVLLTTDLIGLFRELSDELANRVEKELGLPRQRLMLTSSHTHTAPLLNKSNLQMYDLSEQQQHTVIVYTKDLKQALFTVIQKSLDTLAPMTVSFGTGTAHVAVNRRAFTPDRVRIGVNPDGPVANQVPVLAVSDEDGQRRAVLFGYACHATTLKADDYYQICGDYIGFAREYLELSQPGLTGMFVAGCGGDINPYPRGTINMARLHGLHLAGAIADVIKLDRQPVNGPIRCAFKTIELPFARIPTAAEFRERLQSDNRHVQRHARYFLEKLEQGKEIAGTYPYPIQVWRFGNDLTLIALGGEVVVDYALRLQRELPGTNVWIIAYANDVCGYIGSARTLYEGGYEADESTIYYMLPTRWDFSVEEKIIGAVKEMVEEMGG